jgi:hypothetical protein
MRADGLGRAVARHAKQAEQSFAGWTNERNKTCFIFIEAHAHSGVKQSSEDENTNRTALPHAPLSSSTQRVSIILGKVSRSSAYFFSTCVILQSWNGWIRGPEGVCVRMAANGTVHGVGLETLESTAQRRKRHSIANTKASQTSKSQPKLDREINKHSIQIRTHLSMTPSMRLCSTSSLRRAKKRESRRWVHCGADTFTTKQRHRGEKRVATFAVRINNRGHRAHEQRAHEQKCDQQWLGAKRNRTSAEEHTRAAAATHLLTMGASIATVHFSILSVSQPCTTIQRNDQQRPAEDAESRASNEREETRADSDAHTHMNAQPLQQHSNTRAHLQRAHGLRAVLALQLHRDLQRR